MLKKLLYLNSFMPILIAFSLTSNVSAEPSSSEPITTLKCNQFTFDASSSYDPDNENISYFWDFGDGNTSTNPVTQHTYDKSGDYTVTLTTTDNAGLECSTSIVTQNVRANLPPKAILETEDVACVNQPIDMDSSGSYDDTANNLSFEWNFGDGTKGYDEDITSKSYSKGGNYNISLTVDDNSNTVCNTDSITKSIHVNEPPIADAGESEILKCISEGQDLTINFDASNTTDANNDKLSYSWDFGDGETGEGMRTSHLYSDAGNYDVKLIVKDGTDYGCGTNVDFITLKLNKAPKSDAGDDTIACPNEFVSFNGANSFVNKRGTAEAKWFFGDGESELGFKVDHAYSKPGKYQAVLTLENKLNETCPISRDTKVVEINSTPTGTLEAGGSVCLGTKVDFDASSATDPDGDPLEYYWSFGDGEILKAGPKVSHDYKQGGEYRITVIIDDGKGTACSTATASTNVLVNTPPTADAGPNLACCVDKETVFDASASSDPDGDYLTYSWDLGDGNTKEGEVINHRFSKSGRYNVTLTVDDNSQTSCSKAKASFVAEVNSMPVGVIKVR